jgi:hypothetical protein
VAPLEKENPMNRRMLSTLAVCSALLAATAFIPAAQAGNVAWSVSVGGPGFAVSAGQPGFYGGYYRAPYLRPIARPNYRPWYGAAIVVPPVTYVRPRVIYPYYAPAPVVYAPRPIVYAQPYGYGYPYYAPGNGSY